MKIAFLLYPTRGVKVDEDSSFWIMHELQKRGHEVFYFESRHLFWQKGSVYAFLTPARLHAKKGYLPSSTLPRPADLSTFQCLFIRKEPPLDSEYLNSLQLIDIIRDRVFIINDPRGIAMANEKTFILSFRKYIPETIVTNDVKAAGDFIRELDRKVVVKSLHGKGGEGIFLTAPDNPSLVSLLEIAMERGKQKVLIQRYLPENKSGDKRILILNGEPLGVFGRKPSRNDFRANLSAGGSLRRASLTAWDKKLVECMSEKLGREGLLFVGIDVIGRYLTEVNVTSPAGIPEINSFKKSRLERRVADFIEGRL